MLASSGRGRLGTGPWLAERKFDGSRTIAVVDGEVRFFSRYGKDATLRLRHLATDIPIRPMVLDGEAVAFAGTGDDYAAVKRGRATHYVAFDVLFLDGQDTRQLPLRRRRELLSRMDFGPRVIRSHAVEGDPSAMLEAACKEGWEGLIAKQADSTYQSGRSPAWRKLKCRHEADFAVAGYKENPGGAPSLLLADGERFVAALRAGLDDAALRVVADYLARLPAAGPRANIAGAVWVDSPLVCRASFVSKTPDGSLRQARIAGLHLHGRTWP